jgi:hypothetical protein
MSETMGRLLAAGQRAEVFEWGSRAVKLYRCAAAKQTAFREAAIHAAVEVLGGIVTVTGGVQRVGEVEPRFMRRQPHLASGRLLRL